MNIANYERIQKVLARHGHGSRRKVESMIQEERIRINGQIAKLGDKVCNTDIIALDNKPITLDDINQTKVLIYNKPTGEICSRNDPYHEKNVFENLPELDENGRWVMVGRLDINSQGLVIFTNNGDYAHKLMHPNYKVSRVYKVRVATKLDDQQLKKLVDGIELEDGIAKFDSIRLVRELSSNCWYKIIISSGKNRIIRRMLASQHASVSKLIRISYGKYNLPYSLKPGHYKFVNREK